MTHTLITGLQWGDEGKGKFTDYLAARHDITIRFNGGNNAGHTVQVNQTTLHLSLIPSGVLHGKKVLIAPGVVINPSILLEEIDRIKSFGVTPDLGIDPRCHLVMPYHQLMDAASEAYKGKRQTGSLKLGIGFCYEDRTNRAGIRLLDTQSKSSLEAALNHIWELKQRRITQVYQQPFPLHKEQVLADYLRFGRRLKPYLLPVPEYLTQHPEKKVLFESAQGFYLDFTYGTYPYTVAYATHPASALSDSGLPPQKLNIYGIIKSYLTRVGNGPHPTEQTNATGRHLQTLGHEFGTVSKRPRRCGWLDLNLVRHAATLSGVNQLFLTKIDVLTGLKTVKIATAYRFKKQLLHTPPLNQKDLDKITPVYTSLPGWDQDITHIRHFQQLPKPVKTYVRFIASQLKIPIRYLSVGPSRHQTLSVPRSELITH